MDRSSSSTRSGVTRTVAASESAPSATDTARRRKRGALLDISNNAKKLSQTRSTRRGAAVVKKEPQGAGVAASKAKPKAKPASKETSTRSRPPLRSSTRTSATEATAASNKTRCSSSASTTSVGSKRSSAALKKTEGPVKKRKHEAAGLENQPPAATHQKRQTSMLSFQQAKPSSTTRSSRLRNAAADKADDASNADTKATKTAKAATDETQEHAVAEVKQEIKQIEAPQPRTTAALETRTTQRDEFAPRPYRFTFNRSGSCFDEETYAAKVRDIDAPGETMSSHCAKLVHEMDEYHRQHETKYQPEADYIGTFQTDLNEKMRTILIDWLVEVGEEYELDSQTFHKAVNLVDRCLKLIKINRKQFQLLGCACMMIAAKFEEVYGPNVEEFVYISDQTYTAEEMLGMEANVLKVLDFRVAATTCYGFVPRFVKAGCNSEKQRSLVLYLCDFALLFYHLLRHRPSKIVASAVYLARVMTDEAEPWTPTLHHYTKYNPSDLQDCIMEVHSVHSAEARVLETQRDKAKAVSEKYLADKFHAASTIPACDEAELLESFALYVPSTKEKTTVVVKE